MGRLYLGTLEITDLILRLWILSWDYGSYLGNVDLILRETPSLLKGIPSRVISLETELHNIVSS